MNLAHKITYLAQGTSQCALLFAHRALLFMQALSGTDMSKPRKPLCQANTGRSVFPAVLYPFLLLFFSKKL
jgi:hypothetical protein